MADSPSWNLSDLTTFRNNERSFEALYVTQERQRWRERIRELTIEVAKIAAADSNLLSDEIQKLYKIRAEFRVRLNSYDNNDAKIIEAIDKIIEQEMNRDERVKLLKDFEIEVSWLLKEDWERVKYDTRPLWSLLVKKVNVDRGNKKVDKPCDKPCAVWFFKIVPFIVLNIILIIFINVVVGTTTFVFNYATDFKTQSSSQKQNTSQEKEVTAPLPSPAATSPNISVDVNPIVNVIQEHDQETKISKKQSTKKTVPALTLCEVLPNCLK